MTREERKRYNRRWFWVRLGVFLIGVAVFFLIFAGAEYLADVVLALTWNG